MALLALAPAAGADDPATGLWVGNVVIEKVNRPGKAGGAWDPDQLLTAANPFAFRLLVHVSTNGQARLLQRVLAVWNPNGDVVTNKITGQAATNGFYVLLQDESQVQSYLDSQPGSKVYRVSTINLPLMAPQAMEGAFGGTGTLACTVRLPYDDPVNPFVHPYAPLHDNHRVMNSERIKLPAGEESYDITREVTLAFAAQDPDNATNPRWGTREAGGEYREILSGLYQPIRVQGRFRLERLSTIGRLEP